MSAKRHAAFEDFFDLAEVQRLQDAFAAAIGAASVIVDPVGHAITRPSGLCALCEELLRSEAASSAACPFAHAAPPSGAERGSRLTPCLGGTLSDASAPIHVGGRHVASWRIGQVVADDGSAEQIVRRAAERGADPEVVRRALQRAARMPVERFRQLAGYLQVHADVLARMAQNTARTDLAPKEDTDRRRAVQEERLPKSAVLGSIPNGVAWRDAVGRYLGCNRAFADLVGLTDPEAIVGKTDHDLPWSEGAPSRIASAAANALLPQGAPFEVECEVTSRPGDRASVRVSVSRLERHPGREPAVMVSVTDLSDLKRTEDALRRSESMLAAAFHGSPDAIAITSLVTSRVIDANARAAELAGLSRSELMDGDLPTIGLWSNGADFVAARQTLLRGGQIRDEEVRLSRAGGSDGWISLSATPVDIGGEPCALWVARDITERVRAREKLRDTEDRF